MVWSTSPSAFPLKCVYYASAIAAALPNTRQTATTKVKQ